MIHRRILFSLVVLATTLATTAHAEIIVINNILLDGLQPADPTFSSATGIATATIDTDTRRIDIQGTFQGLLAPVIGAHLHGPADIGEPSFNIIFQLIVIGETEGTFSANRSVSPTNLAAILDSHTYLNIHTTAHTSGEIRGQLIVPAPSAFAFFAVAALGATRRRR